MGHDALKCKGVRAIRDWVIIEEMNFKERISRAGLIILGDDGKSEGIRPRWGKVYAVGPKQDHIKIGQWIMLEHGRWTRGFDIEDENGKQRTVRRADISAILLVSNEKPDDSTLSQQDCPVRK